MILYSRQFYLVDKEAIVHNSVLLPEEAAVCGAALKAAYQTAVETQSAASRCCFSSVIIKNDFSYCGDIVALFATNTGGEYDDNHGRNDQTMTLFLEIGAALDVSTEQQNPQLPRKWACKHWSDQPRQIEVRFSTVVLSFNF